MNASFAANQTILVVGGGISGMTAALEAAEYGKQVILFERNTSLGGRTALLYRFPRCATPPAAWRSTCAASRPTATCAC